MSNSISRWSVPLAIVLGLPIGLTVGREYGGDDRGKRLIYGGAAGITAALCVAGGAALVAQRRDKDADAVAEPNPATRDGSCNP